MGGPDKDRNSRVKFMKRCKTLKAKAQQLADLYGANVYLFIDHERGSFVYNSVSNGSWPPPDEVLEQHYPNLDRPGFNETEHSPEPATEEVEQSPEFATFEMERVPKPATSELKQLRRYFARRLQLLHSLDDFYKDKDLAYNITEKGASAVDTSGCSPLSGVPRGIESK
ncbi:hypothetical protein N7486_001063 [Penicillium sp. IBT 16267x]|nr:hypothetical protein N7486_001063 [Penicillium sp. IBT 16267x]